MYSRRRFIKHSSVAGLGFAANLHRLPLFVSPLSAQRSPLYTLSAELLSVWGQALLSKQIKDPFSKDYGGIWCDAHQQVHGRVADTIYPFFHLAHTQKDKRYIDASVLLYDWMEKHVSQPDGSWLNEPEPGSWKGITVFTAIALAETIQHHGALMDPGWKATIENRLRKAGHYIEQTFTIEYGNINYPITAAYGLSLLGELLNEPGFTARGRSLAHAALPFFTQQARLLSGEGDPYFVPSKKGCFSIDPGYNVEESLPSLVQYCLLTKDEEVLQIVMQSLRTHLEFMLPDGAWDNSWGTRNYKWSYWGSRTSDGSQAAFALLADHEPLFYKAALLNTQLLQQCTKDGLLQGGLHNAAHAVTPCVHHTFCHSKALATILDKGNATKVYDTAKLSLPRERPYGVRFIPDIQTWFIAKGPYRATVTAYDREYKKTKNGHASGGALSMLFHEKAGPLLVASMNAYQLFEAGNMQADKDPLSMPLTPRISLTVNENTYMNISDLAAVVTMQEEKGIITLKAISKLVDKDQQEPPQGGVRCTTIYTFSENKVTLQFLIDKDTYGEDLQIIVPVIISSAETYALPDDHTMQVQKKNAAVTVVANKPIAFLPVTGSRLFNFVPGLEAVPVVFKGNEVTIMIS